MIDQAQISKTPLEQGKKASHKNTPKKDKFQKALANAEDKIAKKECDNDPNQLAPSPFTIQTTDNSMNEVALVSPLNDISLDTIVKYCSTLITKVDGSTMETSVRITEESSLFFGLEIQVETIQQDPTSMMIGFAGPNEACQIVLSQSETLLERLSKRFPTKTFKVRSKSASHPPIERQREVTS